MKDIINFLITLIEQEIKEKLGDIEQKTGKGSKPSGVFDEEIEFLDELLVKYRSTSKKRALNFYDIKNSEFLLACALDDFYECKEDYDFNQLREDIDMMTPLLNSMSQVLMDRIATYFDDPDNQGEIAQRLENDQTFRALKNLQEKYKLKNTMQSFSVILPAKIEIGQNLKSYNDTKQAANLLLEKYFYDTLEIISKNRNLDAIMNVLSNLKKNLLGLDKDLLKAEKDMVKKYRDLLKRLRNNNDEPIFDIDPEFRKYIEHTKPNILFVLLYLITSNKERRYRESVSINTVLNQLHQEEQMDDIDQLLLEYKILGTSLTFQTRSLLKQCSIEKIRTCLEIFSRSGLSITELLNNGLAYVIVYSTPDIIMEILDLCNQKILNLNFIRKNLGVFIKQDSNIDSKYPNPIYDIITANIAIFKKYEPAFASEYYYTPEMLLSIPSEVQANSILLGSYFKNNESSSLQFLVVPCIFDILDYFIENDFDISLLKNIDLSKVRAEVVIKRLEILKAIESQVTDQLIMICFNQDAPFPPDELLDTFIINEAPNAMNSIYRQCLDSSSNNSIGDKIPYLDCIKMLDKDYSDDGITYDFGGIIISRKRVIRHLTTLLKYYSADAYKIGELVFTSIIYGKTLGNEELECIKQCLGNVNMNVNAGDEEKARY